MKKLVAKMRKVKAYKWNMLSSGEKVLKVVMKLVKLALIAVLVAGAVALAAGVGFAVIVALGVANAVGGGFRNASRAYRPGDGHVRF